MTPQKFTKLVSQLAKAETELTRAMNKWHKIRGQIKRAEKTLDKQFNNRASEIGGKYDVRDLAEQTNITKRS
jgi:hypothetical protein